MPRHLDQSPSLRIPSGGWTQIVICNVTKRGRILSISKEQPPAEEEVELHLIPPPVQQHSMGSKLLRQLGDVLAARQRSMAIFPERLRILVDSLSFPLAVPIAQSVTTASVRS
jgi:hypothetical protein